MNLGPYFKFGLSATLAVFFFFVLVMLTGCNFLDEPDFPSENPIPFVEEATEMCEHFGGLKSLRTQHWQRSGVVHIYAVCNDDTYLQRKRKE